jgi:hypothetical protein
MIMRYIIEVIKYLAGLFGNIWELKRTLFNIFFSEILAEKNAF